MQHASEDTRADQVGPVQITFTSKQRTAWGGACSVVAKFLERIRFREWVLTNRPIAEHSPNAKGIYEKVLALLLTGGPRFSHVTWWRHGLVGLQACFGVAWSPQATSVLTRFFGKFRQRQNEALRTAAAGLAGQRIATERITEDTLLLDRTVCERYGAQAGARKGYNPKQPGRPRHHPLKAGLGRGSVGNRWNRRGDTHTAPPCVACYEQPRVGLPSSRRMGGVLADSGFGEEGLLEHWAGNNPR